jgi:hypothetical protein
VFFAFIFDLPDEIDNSNDIYSRCTPTNGVQLKCGELLHGGGIYARCYFLGAQNVRGHLAFPFGDEWWKKVSFKKDPVAETLISGWFGR